MVNPEVIGEAELVDVLFEPDAEKSRTSLGLLGEFLCVPSIIEILRWAPDQWDIQDCMRHWLAWKAEADSSIIPVDETPVYTYSEENEIDSEENEELEVDKILLIIVPSITPQYLKGFGAKPSAMNIPGIYEG